MPLFADTVPLPSPCPLRDATIIQNSRLTIPAPSCGGCKSMPQLVGSVCVKCHERIGSILDGHFCRSCSQPVHEACVPREPLAKSSANCELCGCENSAQPCAGRYGREPHGNLKSAEPGATSRARFP